jgi:hypothetical protein
VKEKNICISFELNENLIEDLSRPKAHLEKKAEYERYDYPLQGRWLTTRVRVL